MFLHLVITMVAVNIVEAIDYTAIKKIVRPLTNSLTNLNLKSLMIYKIINLFVLISC